MLIAALIIGAVWSALHLVTVGDRVADREAARALEEARAMELLLRDLRSSDGPVQTPADQVYRLTRWTRQGERLASIEVEWRVHPDHRITRTVGDKVQTFTFDAQMDRARKPFRLRVEKDSGLEWSPDESR